MKVQSEMPIYISLVNYTESGLRDIKKSRERLAAAGKEAEELSGKVDKVYLTMGNRDLITIADYPTMRPQRPSHFALSQRVIRVQRR